jgi:formylglycine-generating enzyme required for sulfatase activity
MGRTEVTNAQFRRFRPGHNSKLYKGKSLNGDRQPAVYVNWQDATAFARWLSEQTSGTYRLPTEAEWEYACRGGTNSKRPWGDRSENACQYANVADMTARTEWPDWVTHECDDGYAVSAPVGDFQPNGFGLYDILGNVWEWCEDVYDSGAYRMHARRNPKISSGASRRVLRGGCWVDKSVDVRCANRYGGAPGYPSRGLGFRLLREQ